MGPQGVRTDRKGRVFPGVVEGVVVEKGNNLGVEIGLWD